ncbi:MAG TPA: flagellin [Alphaproteobacteria bacterium]|jgi:flagellar hook-associated protein 3 FlgL|nr:flagellin [Alphaproteobacteria bacterium]
MTRISTFAHSQALLQQMLRSQQAVVDSEKQVSSGKKADTIQGYARDANALLSTRSLGDRIQSYIDSNKELAGMLELQNNALGEIAQIGDDLRTDLIESVNLNSGVGVAKKLEDHLARLIDAVNTRYNGRYLFGGTRAESKPVTITDAAGLLGLATTGDAFSNSSVKPTQQVDDDRTLTYGQLASDVAQPLMDVIRRVLQFENGTLPSGAGAYAPAGSFQDPLTQNQHDFLVSEFSNALSAIDTARNAEAENGVNMATLDRLSSRQGDDLTFVKGFAGQLENVDTAEAISKLQQGQTALTASLQVISRVNQISLLNFL